MENSSDNYGNNNNNYISGHNNQSSDIDDNDNKNKSKHTDIEDKTSIIIILKKAKIMQKLGVIHLVTTNDGDGDSITDKVNKKVAEKELL